jgi:hypothetical protein
MKKFFLLFAMLVCVSIGHAQAPINETLLPTVMGFKFGTDKYRVKSYMEKNYPRFSFDYGDKYAVLNPLLFGRRWKYGEFTFDGLKLCGASFIYNATSVEEADKFYRDFKDVLERKYGEGVKADIAKDDIIRMLDYGKHSQREGMPCCAYQLSKTDDGYEIFLYYYLVDF